MCRKRFIILVQWILFLEELLELLTDTIRGFCSRSVLLMQDVWGRRKLKSRVEITEKPSIVPTLDFYCLFSPVESTSRRGSLWIPAGHMHFYSLFFKVFSMNVYMCEMKVSWRKKWRYYSTCLRGKIRRLHLSNNRDIKREGRKKMKSATSKKWEVPQCRCPINCGQRNPPFWTITVSYLNFAWTCKTPAGLIHELLPGHWIMRVYGFLKFILLKRE